MPSLRHLLPSVLALLHPATAASLQPVTASLNNPTKVGFFIYVPDRLQPHPPILVNPHWCHGSAQAAYTGTQLARLADTHGFVVVYPDSPHTADKCWDVSSRETLSHAGGGDSLGIVSMARWALGTYAGDAARVFVAGVSSGAMMASTLAAAYPDVFAAASAWSGVPFGCFAAPGNNSGVYGAWNDGCAKGRVVRSSAVWAASVRAAFPGYTGWRPKVQIFHGTKDETLDYSLLDEEVKLWTGVLGLAETPVRTVRDAPLKGWTKAVYGEQGWFEATSAGNVSHNIPVQEKVIMEWFDLACKTDSCFAYGKGGPVAAKEAS